MSQFAKASNNKIEPVRLDGQMVSDMLDKDNCPASMGEFLRPSGESGLVMILAKPEHKQALRDFLQSLYDQAGYVSPIY